MIETIDSKLLRFDNVELQTEKMVYKSSTLLFDRLSFRARKGETVHEYLLDDCSNVCVFGLDALPHMQPSKVWDCLTSCSVPFRSKYNQVSTTYIVLRCHRYVVDRYRL